MKCLLAFQNHHILIPNYTMRLFPTPAVAIMLLPLLCPQIVVIVRITFGESNFTTDFQESTLEEILRLKDSLEEDIERQNCMKKKLKTKYGNI